MSTQRPSLDSTLTPEHLAELRRGGPSVQDKAARAVLAAGLGRSKLTNANPYRPVALYADPRIIGPRWPFAVMRIRRILEGVAKSSSITDAVNGAEYKKLAKEYVETYSYYLTRTRPAPIKGADHNPFRNLSDRDAFKKFVRAVEDICDRSTSEAGLGRWYV